MAKANAAYTQAMKIYAGCAVGKMHAPAGDFNCGAAPTRQTVKVPPNATPAQRQAAVAAAAAVAAVPVITPQQAAEITIASQLRIPTVAPGFGPSPDLNQWKIAAVGYPYWLWGEGTTQTQAANTVDGITVSLNASVSSMTFAMGDGHTITCEGSGSPWHRGMAPATPSPTCGYTYQEPSRPGGDYTVTATSHWAVKWTAGGQNGVINLDRANSIQVPVGELQAIITHG